MVHGEVYQASCAENKIERLHNRSKKLFLNLYLIDFSFFSFATWGENYHIYCYFVGGACDYLCCDLPDM